MSDFHKSAQQTALLHIAGWIYAWILLGFLLWTAAFALMYCASHADKSIPAHHARLKKALYWMYDFEPTPQVYRIAEWMIGIYFVSFMFITFSYSISELSWAGWIFVQHMIAIGIASIAASAYAAFRIARLPPGQTLPQACYLCFVRK